VHLVGFITKKFVTMHGHTNVKLRCSFYYRYRDVKFFKGVKLTPLSKVSLSKFYYWGKDSHVQIYIIIYDITLVQDRER